MRGSQDPSPAPPSSPGVSGVREPRLPGHATGLPYPEERAHRIRARGCGVIPRNLDTEIEGEPDESARDHYGRTRRARLPGERGQPRFPADARPARGTVGGTRPANRRRGGRQLQPANRLRARRAQGPAHASAPGVRCREGRVSRDLALAVRIRQEGHPLLAAARPNGRGGRAGSRNEQDRVGRGVLSGEGWRAGEAGREAPAGASSPRDVAVLGRPDRARGRTGIRASGREARVGGRPVRYEAAGKGEPVVLVHGLSGSTRWWARNVSELAERHRVYLVDLPGFGTMRRSRGRFVLAEATTWLSEWMGAVGLERAHFVGHSMGGYVCLRLAAGRPEAVRRLVLVAPAGVPTGRSMVGHLGPLLGAALSATPAFLPVLLRDALRVGPATLWRAARDLLAEDVREDLRRIEAPALLVWGERDTLVPPATGALLRQEIEGSRLLVIEGAGHVPMFDRPEEFDAALLAFLAGETVGD